MSGTNQHPIIKFLSSSSIVGATAILALVLSVGQLIWPIGRELLTSYSVEIESPDVVNFFCSGSEGIDADANQRPICNGNNSVVLMATPLFYINKGGEDKTVWLRREVVDVNFLDQSERTVKEIALAWWRVSSNDRWHAPGVEQIDPKKAISHSTLFYPETFGCSKDVQGSLCQTANSYRWADFADRVIKHEVTHVVFSFEPAIRGPAVQTVRKCRWNFTESDIADLKAWRSQLEEIEKLGSTKATDGSVSPPYALLAANCTPMDTAQ